MVTIRFVPIDAYVDALDLNELGFREVGSDGGAGQPPYDPADLLKLYLYGYLHQVRSCAGWNARRSAMWS